jgi:hypothetical protein
MLKSFVGYHIVSRVGPIFILFDKLEKTVINLAVNKPSDIQHPVIPAKAHGRQLKGFCAGIPDGTQRAMIRIKSPDV